jgi:predicted methyltransferase
MENIHRFLWRLVVGIVALCLGGAIVIAQGRADQEKQREAWQRVSDIFQAMGVRPGAVVADVGAGGGFFTSRLATSVGPSGQVFAVDVDDAQLDRLRRRLTDEGHRNVTLIKGTSADPRLSPASLDAALIVNAYHEMPEHQAMLDAIRSALKPTGRLVIVEPISDARRTVARADQRRDHEIGPEFVLQDARAAGFSILGLQDPFTTRGGVVEWMLTVTPSTASTAVVLNTPAPATSESSREDWRDPTLRISGDELVKLTQSGAATIIDVRDEEVFAKGHIPTAVLIPLEDIETSAERVRGLKRPLVTYCS